MKLFTKLYIRLAMLLSAFPAYAQLGVPPSGAPFGLPGDSNTTASGVLERYITVFLVVVGILAVAYLIYGGFRYITAGDNEETAEGAKRIIRNSIIGLVVIILSYVIVAVIFNALARQRA